MPKTKYYQQLKLCDRIELTMNIKKFIDKLIHKLN